MNCRMFYLAASILQCVPVMPLLILFIASPLIGQDVETLVLDSSWGDSPIEAWRVESEEGEMLMSVVFDRRDRTRDNGIVILNWHRDEGTLMTIAEAGKGWFMSGNRPGQMNAYYNRYALYS